MFWLWPVVAITASYGHYGQRAARIGPDIIIMPDPTSRIRFSSVFPKKAWITLCKTDPGPIWMAWSGSGQTRQVQKQARVLESPGQVSGRTQPVRCQFLTFTLVPFFHRHCAKPAWIRFNSDLIPADCVKRIRSGSKPMCKNHPARFWAMFPSRAGAVTPFE